MSNTQITLLVGAVVLLFWAVGAYNRLVRLRAAIRTHFVQLDAQLLNRHELIPQLADTARAVATEMPPSDAAAYTAATAARLQANAALELARQKPAMPGPMVSLAMAEQVLEDAFGRLQDVIDADQTVRGDPAVMALRENVFAADGRLALTRQIFNDAVQQHNHAVQQFPTRLLCSVYGFRDAASLPPPVNERARAV